MIIVNDFRFFKHLQQAEKLENSRPYWPSDVHIYSRTAGKNECNRGLFVPPTGF